MAENLIGELIHYYRKQSSLSEKELTRLAGVGKIVIFDIERGSKNYSRMDKAHSFSSTYLFLVDKTAPLILNISCQLNLTDIMGLFSK